MLGLVSLSNPQVHTFRQHTVIGSCQCPNVYKAYKNKCMATPPMCALLNISLALAVLHSDVSLDIELLHDEIIKSKCKDSKLSLFLHCKSMFYNLLPNQHNAMLNVCLQVL